MKEKLHFFRGFAVSVLSFLIYCGIFVAAFLIVCLIFSLLSKIPILSRLLDWFLFIRGDSPNSFAVAIACIPSGLITLLVSEKLNRYQRTFKMSRILTGSYIAVAAIVYFIICIIASQPVWPAITLLIFGVLPVMFFK